MAEECFGSVRTVRCTLCPPAVWSPSIFEQSWQLRDSRCLLHACIVPLPSKPV